MCQICRDNKALKYDKLKIDYDLLERELEKCKEDYTLLTKQYLVDWSTAREIQKQSTMQVKLYQIQDKISQAMFGKPKKEEDKKNDGEHANSHTSLTNGGYKPPSGSPACCNRNSSPCGGCPCKPPKLDSPEHKSMQDDRYHHYTSTKPEDRLGYWRNQKTGVTEPYVSPKKRGHNAPKAPDQKKS